MSSIQEARIDSIDADIAEFEYERDYRIQNLENKIGYLQVEIDSLKADYNSRIEQLKKQKAHISVDKLQTLKDTLLELAFESDGGKYEEDAGVLRSFIKEMKKIVQLSTPKRTSHMSHILENLLPSYYHSDIEKLVDKTIELYNELIV